MTDVTLLFLADQTLPAVTASLEAHAEALNRLEAVGHRVEALLVAHSSDPGVAALLHCVEGARVAELDRYVGAGAAWEASWPSCRTTFVYLCTASSVPEPEALERLVARMVRDPGLAVALPTSAAPPAALVRADVLSGVRRARGVALSGGRQPMFVVDELVRTAASAGLRTTVVPDAVLGGLPLLQPPTVLRPQWVPAELRLAHPDAVTMGPGSFFTGSGARVTTYSPLETVEIGSYCSIADEVRLVNPHDPRDAVLSPDGDLVTPRLRNAHRPWTATTLPVGNRFHHLAEFDDPSTMTGAGARMVIGSDVWIGYRAMVVGPVTIGHGAVVGAGAVVVRDVEPYAVVAGNPARTVRMRFDDATVAGLLELAWWDWREDEIQRAAEAFLLPAEQFVELFIAREGLEGRSRPCASWASAPAVHERPGDRSRRRSTAPPARR